MIVLNYASLLTSQNIRAFERVIREGESSQTDAAYRMRYGGWNPETRRYNPPAYFDDFSQHPRVMELTPTGERSSAAGAYQHTYRTWSSVCMEKYGLGPAFGPYEQDCGYVALLHHRGALDDVIDGKFDDALHKCRSEWASLPDSPLNDGGSKLTYARARAVYSAWGGSFYDPNAYVIRPESAPIEDRSVPAQQEDIDRINAQESPMAAPMLLIGPILQVITELIPALGTLFGKNAEKYKDKIGAATQVVDIVTRAVGGTNAQDAVEKIQSDPVELQKAKVAVLGDPMIGPMLTEVGGGVDAARKADADPERARFWLSGAFWIALTLTPLIYMVTYKVLWGTFSEQLQTVVVTAILSGLLGALTGFFFGAMFNNSRNPGQQANVR